MIRVSKNSWASLDRIAAKTTSVRTGRTIRGAMLLGAAIITKIVTRAKTTITARSNSSARRKDPKGSSKEVMDVTEAVRISNS